MCFQIIIVIQLIKQTLLVQVLYFLLWLETDIDFDSKSNK